MRDGFREIVSGWRLVDGFSDLDGRIERLSEWAKVNGPLEADEIVEVEMMVEAQFVLGHQWTAEQVNEMAARAHAPADSRKLKRTEV